MKEELVGKKFNRLVLIRELEPIIYTKRCRHRIFECKCDCGKIIVAHLNNLKNNHTVSCGCFKNEQLSNLKSIPLNDLLTKKFGRLTIIGEVLQSDEWRRNMICKCDCGNEVIISLSNLRQRHTKSCGCFLKDWAKENKTTHGLSNHSLFRIWTGIKSRCGNPNASHFENYGGRGITICDEWKNDFKTFYDWSMANGYQKGLEIDRINNDGNYEPSNCRWVTHQINSQNKFRRVI